MMTSTEPPSSSPPPCSTGLELAGKKIEDVKIVTSGAGAAALACLNLLVSLGAKLENIWVTDRFGVAYKGRVDEMDRWKDPYVKDTEARLLADVIAGADVFLGLSAAGVLKPELLKDMAPKPLILALANPTPEIMPEVARAARPDAMICTGVLIFPIKSITYCAFLTSFGVRWTAAPARSTKT